MGSRAGQPVLLRDASIRRRGGGITLHLMQMEGARASSRPLTLIRTENVHSNTECRALVEVAPRETALEPVGAHSP